MSKIIVEPAYLGTPYSRYAKGIDAAYRDACKLTARLIRTGIAVFSPIAHSHGIAIHGNIDPLDQQFWYEFDRSMLHVCRTLIVAHMEGWESSSGIAEEIRFFEERGRPIFDLDIHSLMMVQRGHAALSYQIAAE